jgi:hypothetical protein
VGTQISSPELSLLVVIEMQGELKWGQPGMESLVEFYQKMERLIPAPELYISPHQNPC